MLKSWKLKEQERGWTRDGKSRNIKLTTERNGQVSNLEEHIKASPPVQSSPFPFYLSNPIHLSACFFTLIHRHSFLLPFKFL
jgi:hypothetical protein